MRLNELSPLPAEPKVEQAAWDAWDLQIAADLQAGKLDAQIEAARNEAEGAEAL